ncbi:MAG: MarR family transcriptional regulator [Sphingomonadaceae bacterium]
MMQANFAYGQDTGTISFPLRVSVFTDDEPERQCLLEDILSLGLQPGICGSLDQLHDDNCKPPSGDLVLVDFPGCSGRKMAALSHLDMCVAQSGGQLVIYTSMDALDAVFACVDQSSSQILVKPERADRLIAIGCAIANLGDSRLRELSDDERLMLLRLTEQVSRMARQVERMSTGLGGPPDAGLLEANSIGAGSNVSDSHDGVYRFRHPSQMNPADEQQVSLRDSLRREVSNAPAFPSVDLVRRIIRLRQLRGRFFDSQQFADPAWDILLDLTAARAERKRVSVTSLCIASGVPPTTALRWIVQMTDADILERAEDPADKRRAFIRLSDKSADSMAHYFAEVKQAAMLPV